jgi:hypothetical protein
MSPKSLLYTLVHAWKNKPFYELRDVQGTHVPNLAHETQDTGSNANWSKRQTVSYEPIFNAAGNAMSAALFRPLLGASDSQVLRFTMEGLDAASYWHCCNRPIQILLPLSPGVLANPQRIDALCDLILNSRLPVGLVHIGVTAIPSEALRSNCKEGLLRLRRIGVLLHLMNANPQSIQPQWLEDLATLENELARHFTIEEIDCDTEEDTIAFPQLGKGSVDQNQIGRLILHEIMEVHHQAIAEQSAGGISQSDLGSLIHKIKGGALLMNGLHFANRLDSLAANRADSTPKRAALLKQLLLKQNSVIDAFLNRDSFE